MANGGKAGPAKQEVGGFWAMSHMRYDIFGLCYHAFHRYVRLPQYDLIAEWPDEQPVRTVTRKEIVPGVYGKLSIHQLRGERGEVYLAFVDNITHKENTIHATVTSHEIRAAIATLQQIADAMENQNAD